MLTNCLTSAPSKHMQNFQQFGILRRDWSDLFSAPCLTFWITGGTFKSQWGEVVFCSDLHKVLKLLRAVGMSGLTGQGCEARLPADAQSSKNNHLTFVGAWTGSGVMMPFLAWLLKECPLHSSSEPGWAATALCGLERTVFCACMCNSECVRPQGGGVKVSWLACSCVSQPSDRKMWQWKTDIYFS